MSVDLPRVPLEAGAGPENPPCPACGEPLFPWVGMPVATGIAHRCEACGLGVLSHGVKFNFDADPVGVGEAGATVGDAVGRTSPGSGEAAGPVGGTVGRTSPGVPPASPTAAPAEDAGGYVFNPGTAEDVFGELALGREADGGYVFDNRGSLACWLAGGAWVGLGNDRRYLFTPSAIIDLIATRGQIVTRTRWRPLRGIALMWQSGINMFTFGQNVVLGSLGKADQVTADHTWKRALDWFISVAVAIPAIVIAVPLELLAILFRRGAAARTQIDVI